MYIGLFSEEVLSQPQLKSECGALALVMWVRGLGMMWLSSSQGHVEHHSF